MLSRKTVDDLTNELGKLRAENGGLDLRVKDLEKQLERERISFRLSLKQKDEELSKLRLQLEELELEYAALLEVKIKLDREIEAYRKLLESEETRLNISSSMSSSMTQVAGGSTRKRKRMDIGQAVEEYSQRTSSSGFSRAATSSCGIDITEVDTDGKFVKLTNTTDKDVSLHHWLIKHVSGDNETQHKFQKNVLKAEQTVTVWSADSDQTHNPPSDLVMKGKRWFASGDMSTTLVNADEEEVASCKMTRSIGSVSSFTSRRRGPRDEVDGEDGEPVDKDKCVVM